ncbi:MAG: hypothetical protein IT584_00590 [Chlamydiae bacterium]|nr:hypothetical protein [Chlamydiota bacterium]
MEATVEPSSSGLFGIRFPALSEMSRITRLMLGMLSMTAAVYVGTRSMNGRSFSIDALTAPQKITAGAFFALGLLFTTSVLCQGSKADKVKGREPLPEIPFKDQLPPWLMQAIQDSKLSCSFKSFEVAPAFSSFNNIPDPIIFFTYPKVNGIHLRWQATHSVPDKEPSKVVSGIIWKEENDNLSWQFYKDNELNSIVNFRKLDTYWDPKFLDAPVQLQRDGVTDLDSFENIGNGTRGEIFSLDWLLSRLLSGKECRIKDWSLSFAKEPRPSAAS